MRGQVPMQAQHALLPCKQTRPDKLLLFFVCLVVLHASGTITPEHHARAQKLLQDNLHPTLAFWHELRATHGKLTMQNWFKTASILFKNRRVAYWGVLNNKVVQLHKDGELRYSNDAMMLEGHPNRGAAESMKNPLWLAIEDAISHGISIPNVMFTFNSADWPQCNMHEQMNCSDGTVAPPLSIMGLDVNKVDLLPRVLKGRRPKAFGDLLVPMFKYLGYSGYTSVSSGPHHPNVMKRHSTSWSEANHIRAESKKWEERVPIMFFRGSGYCPHLVFPHPIECPRLYLSNLSIHHQDKLDIMVGNLPPDLRTEKLTHGWHGAFRLGMQDWTRYKYIISIDGLAGSNRDLAVMHTGSVLVTQHRSPYLEWYYKSLVPGVHHEEVFKPLPNGSPNPDDVLDLVDRFRQDDKYARSIAENGLAFAREYLNVEVGMVYLRELLVAYKELFEDMDEYMAMFGDTGNSTVFMQHVLNWQQTPWKASL